MFNSKYKKQIEVPKGIKFTKPSRTKQSEKDATDINKILEKYKKTGILPNMILNDPTYGDFSEALTYQESLNTVLKAREQFDGLSASLREKFQNDPAKFLEFVHYSSDEELDKLGLLTKEASERLKEKNKPGPKEEKNTTGSGQSNDGKPS